MPATTDLPLLAALHALADRIEDGAPPAEVVAELRALAKFTPDEKCARMNSVSRHLAHFDDLFTWRVLTGRDGYGGTEARLVTNHPRPGGKYSTAIDFTHAEPADIDQMGRAICHVARILRGERDNPDED